MAVLNGHSFSNMLEFHDCCNFVDLWCPLSTHPVYWVVLFLVFLVSFLLIN